MQRTLYVVLNSFGSMEQKGRRLFSNINDVPLLLLYTNPCAISNSHQRLIGTAKTHLLRSFQAC